MPNNGLGADLTQLTLEELRARRNKMKGAIIGLGIVMVAALIMMLYVVMKNKTYGLLAILPAMFLSLIPGSIMLSKINEEIKARQSVR